MPKSTLMELLKPKLLSHKLLPCDEEDHKQHKIMDAYSTMSLRNEKVKKWLATFPALNMSLPSVLRFSAVVRVISLYSTT